MASRNVNSGTLFVFGGLGNIAFQLAAARFLRDNDIKVTINNSLCKESLFTRALNWTIHDNFDLLIEEFSEFEISDKLYLIEIIFLVKVFILKRFGISSSFDDLTLNRRRFIGYFQKCLITDKLLDVFVLSVAKSLKAKLNEDLVSDCVIHHRSQESDWTSQENAFAHFGVSSDRFALVHVLTDNVLSAKSIYSDDNLYLISRGDLMDDLSRMTFAKCFLGASSTLSFWACLMNPNEVFIDKSFLKDKMPLRLLDIK